MDWYHYSILEKSIIPIKKLSIQKNWKVLDVGCESGRDVGIIKSYGAEAYGMDISPLARCSVIADARFIPFKNNCFDAVISVLTVSHIKEEKKALKEIRRILKSNGKILLVLFNKSLLNMKSIVRIAIGKSIQFGFMRLHSKKELLELFKSLNFEIIEMYTTDFAPPLIQRFPKFIQNHVYDLLANGENIFSRIPIIRMMGKRVVVIARRGAILDNKENVKEGN